MTTRPVTPAPAGSTSPPLRVAVVGCGAVAEQFHLPVLAGHESVRLAALVDRDLDRARRLAAGYGVFAVFGDAGDLEPDRVDAVVLATPPVHHAPASLVLMSRGIHVLVEKPMALNLAEAEAMVAAAEDAGVVLSVGFFRRLYPSVGLLKALIDDGWLGSPVGFEIEAGGFYSSPAATLSHMSRDLAGGGVLIDYGSHLVDLLFHLFDDRAEVLDYQDNSLGGVEADCVARLRCFHRGRPVEGSLALARTRKLGNFARVLCERGRLEWGFSDRYLVRIATDRQELTDPASGTTRAFSLGGRWEPHDETSWFETFRAEIDDWIGAIRSGRPPVLSARSSLPTVRLIDECYRRPRGTLREAWVTEGTAPAIVKSRPGRVLVTGATGFLGGRVTEILSLRDRTEVRALVHRPGNASRVARLPVELVQGDLSDPVATRRLLDGCDAVVHCAIGTEYAQRRAIFDVTVGGTRHLASAAREAGVRRFVHVSTIAVHGGRVTGTLDEATPVQPGDSDYGQSKHQAEQAVMDEVGNGLCATIVRPSRIFGPFSATYITRPIAALIEGELELETPDHPANLIYVDNLAHFISCVLDAPDDRVGGEVFTASDGIADTWADFYDWFANALAVAPAVRAEAASHADGSARTASRPGWWRGLRTIGTSAEFRALGRRVMETRPVGTAPRWLLDRAPGLRSWIERRVGTGGLPVYRREVPPANSRIRMGSSACVVSIRKAREVLGYAPPVERSRALGLTLAWLQHARIV